MRATTPQIRKVGLPQIEDSCYHTVLVAWAFAITVTAQGHIMFRRSFTTLLAAGLLVASIISQPGCAYTLKETGHRDLDRSVRYCDKCCACAATGAIYTACCAAVVGLFVWDTDGDGETSISVQRSEEDPSKFEVVPE